MRRWAWVLAAPLLVACSQADALQQVSGDALATVRIAVYDVLVQEEIPLKTAPICTQSGTQFTCRGTTLRDEPIEATVSSGRVMTITVGGEQIFSGPVQEVIERTGEGR